MNKNNIVFIAKTNLNTDGRILNQLKILENNFPHLKIDFLLFPDNATKISLSQNVRLIELNTKFRNNKLLRPFTVLNITHLFLNELKRIKPSVIHAQDSAVCLPVILYKKLYDKDVKIIYDDHELPNENQQLFEKLVTVLENNLIRIADYLILANKERLDYLTQQLRLNNEHLYYFLNLPYFPINDSEIALTNEEQLHHNKINEFKSNGFRIIIHQGPVNEARGNKFLKELLKKISDKVLIVFLGGTEKQFSAFIGSEFESDSKKCYFVGSVQYNHLDAFWNLGDASLVLYDPKYINNRLCAPNRYFISLFKGIPVIVNQNNPVLSSLTAKYNSGLFVEDILQSKIDLERIFDVEIDAVGSLDLMNEQIKNLINIYSDFGLKVN